MPRYTPNPTENTAGQLILDKDSYTMEIKKLSPFIFDKNPEKISYGVGATLVVVSEGKFKGKTVNARMFYHTTGAADMAKRFLMVALGFNPAKSDEEEDFNSQYGGADWSFNTDDKSLGSGWDNLVGKLVTGDAQEPKLVDGNMNQNINWRVYAP